MTLFLMLIILVQFGLNWSLLNRLLVAKGVAPITLPEMQRENTPPTPEPRRKLFTVRVAD